MSKNGVFFRGGDVFLSLYYIFKTLGRSLVTFLQEETSFELI